MFHRARRPLATRFRPVAEDLEGRALMAIGQISLYIPSAAVALTGATPVRGTLPDGSIDVQQFNLSTTNTATLGSGSGGSGAGKATFQPLEIFAAAGPEESGLFQAMASGAHFNSMTLTVRDSAARLIETYSFKLVFVTSQTLSGATTDDFPIEDYKFVYGAIEISTYNRAALTVTLQSQTSFSVITGTPTFDVPGVNTAIVKASASSDVTASANQHVVSQDAVSSAAPTTITLTTSKPHQGSTTLTAKVASPQGVPTGNVTFYSGKTELGQVPVGADGKASLTISTSALGRSHVFAIYNGGPDSTFQPATTIQNDLGVKKSFQKWLGRPMRQDEWVLTSMWLQEGFTPTKMANIYKSLASKSS